MNRDPLPTQPETPMARIAHVDLRRLSVALVVLALAILFLIVLSIAITTECVP